MTVIDEIADERRRQVEAEGWTPEHDDKHSDRSLSMAAALYAAPEPLYQLERVADGDFLFRDPWPWFERVPGARGGWLPTRAWDKRGKHDRRRRLVIAAALIVAEIERLDRAAGNP